MTPATYIRLRREAAGMTIAEVEAVLAGGGLLSAPLASLEAGTRVRAGMDAALLSFAFELDDMALAALIDGESVALCPGCACGGSTACEHEHFGRCTPPSAGAGLCSVCELETRSREAMAA